ncbi:AAA family ATPase [Cellulosimicrobium sp. E-16]|uniref:AAA family ATPase n=1 Tax=Cellulosimicrobium sp. E-16 TaxID=3404049 RepID=UPI003CE742D1
MSSDLLSLVRTGDWLDAQTFPELAWTVPGIIPEGFGLLTGPPKLGKSWLALHLGLAVACGSEAFGAVSTGRARPVLYLALEDGDRRLQERSRKLLDGAPIPANLHSVTAMPGASVIDLIGAWLDAHGDDDPLVILDTLGKVMPPSTPGESAYSRDYRIGSGLKRLTDSHPGSTLLVVHHTRKAEGADWMDSTSGTQGLNGSADFTVSLARSRNETEAVLRVTGRDVRENEYAMTSDDGHWMLAGKSLGEAAQAALGLKVSAGLGDRSAEIVAFVAEHPEGVRAVDVANHVGVTEKDAGTYLIRAQRAGRITRMSRGLYGPTTPVGSVGSVGSHVDSHTSYGSYTVCQQCGEPIDPTSGTVHPLCEVAA